MRRLYWALRFWVLNNRLLKKFLRLQKYQLVEHEHIVAEMKASRKQLTGELAEVIFKLTTISENLETILDEMQSDDGEATEPHE